MIFVYNTQNSFLLEGPADDVGSEICVTSAMWSAWIDRCNAVVLQQRSWKDANAGIILRLKSTDYCLT